MVAAIEFEFFCVERQTWVPGELDERVIGLFFHRCSEMESFFSMISDTNESRLAGNGSARLTCDEFVLIGLSLFEVAISKVKGVAE